MRKSCIAIINLLLSGLALVSCDKRPDGVLSDSEMTDLLTDMHLASAYVTVERNGYLPDTARMELVKSVLDKHKVSRSEYDSTLLWYGKNIDLYQELMRNVDKRLAKMQKESGGDVPASGNDLWPYFRHSLITEEGNSNVLIFSIPVSDLEKGCKLTWKLRANNGNQLKMMLGVEYTNGMQSYVIRNFMNETKLNLDLQTDTGLSVSRIFGNVGALSRKGLPLWMDSIALEESPYDSVMYFRIGSMRKYYPPKKHEKKIDKDTVNEAASSHLPANLANETL